MENIGVVVYPNSALVNSNLRILGEVSFRGENLYVTNQVHQFTNLIFLNPKSRAEIHEVCFAIIDNECTANLICIVGNEANFPDAGGEVDTRLIRT